MPNTGEEFKADISKLGMSPRAAADFLDFSLRQSRRINSQQAQLRVGEYLLLKVMLNMGLTPAMVRKFAGLPWPVPKKKKKAKTAA